jgi:hypothetical protein
MPGSTYRGAGRCAWRCQGGPRQVVHPRLCDCVLLCAPVYIRGGWSPHTARYCGIAGWVCNIRTYLCHLSSGKVAVSHRDRSSISLAQGVDLRSTSHVVGKLRQASWGQHTRSTGRPGTSLPISRTLTKPASPFTASCDVRDFLDKPSMPWGALQPEFGESRATQSSRRDGWCRDFRQGY